MQRRRWGAQVSAVVWVEGAGWSHLQLPPFQCRREQQHSINARTQALLRVVPIASNQQAYD